MKVRSAARRQYTRSVFFSNSRRYSEALGNESNGAMNFQRVLYRVVSIIARIKCIILIIVIIFFTQLVCTNIDTLLDQLNHSKIHRSIESLIEYLDRIIWLRSIFKTCLVFSLSFPFFFFTFNSIVIAIFLIFNRISGWNIGGNCSMLQFLKKLGRNDCETKRRAELCFEINSEIVKSALFVIISTMKQPLNFHPPSLSWKNILSFVSFAVMIQKKKRNRERKKKRACIVRGHRDDARTPFLEQATNPTSNPCTAGHEGVGRFVVVPWLHTASPGRGRI